MSLDAENLRISDPEIQRISGVSFHDSFLAEYYRMWGRLKLQEQAIAFTMAEIFQFLALELILFFVLLVLTFPLGILVAKYFGNPGQENFQDLGAIALAIGLATLTFLGLNLYLYFRSKPLLSLLNLLNELEHYEKVVTIFYRMDKLISDGYMEQDKVNRQQMIAALKVTKNSFFHALKAERLVREYRQINLPDELFEILDRNLSELIDFDVQGQDSYYGRLINETLEIGISVHRELRKLQHLNSWGII